MSDTCTIDMPWGACGKPAVSSLKAPPGHEDLPLCADHSSEARALVQAMQADPDLAERFEQAIDDVYEEGLH